MKTSHLNWDLNIDIYATGTEQIERVALKNSNQFVAGIVSQSIQIPLELQRSAVHRNWNSWT